MEGKVLKDHQPCDNCGSRDAKAYYEGGSTFCFSCKHSTHTKGTDPMEHKKTYSKLIEGTIKELPARNIDKETCKKYDYQISLDNTKHLANYRHRTSGKTIAQKTRTKDKQFRWTGNSKEIMLFGQHLFSGGGPRLVITEGEIDTLSISKVFKNKYPVVSIPNGAANAVKDIKANYEWVNSFKEIVIAFDNDQAGQNVVEEVVNLFEPTKAKVVRFNDGFKDANDYLMKGEEKLLINTIWNAEVLRPQGIHSAEDIGTFEDLWENDKPGIPYKFPKLNEMTMGIYPGQVIGVTAGSGIGKTTFVKQLAHDLLVNQNKKIAMVMLEEQIKKTKKSLLAIDLGINYRNFRLDNSIANKEEANKSYEKLFSNRKLMFFDHFGSINSQTLIDKLRYMKVVEGVDILILDHISMIVSGSDLDERKELDVIMTNLASMCKELELTIIYVVHLSRSSSKNYNEGSQISLRDLRGSAGIEQMSYTVIGLERNQQDEEEKNKVNIRVLKNRDGEDTGLADTLMYDYRTGLLVLEEDYEAEPIFKPNVLNNFTNKKVKKELDQPPF